jgi:hypothetical protein
MQLYITSSLNLWHSSFSENTRPLKIATLPKDKPNGTSSTNLNLSNSAVKLANIIYSYDHKAFDVAEAWAYKKLSILTLNLGHGQYKRVLFSPTGIGYDPHPIWLNFLGLFDKAYEIEEIINRCAEENSLFRLNKDIHNLEISSQIEGNKFKYLIQGSTNYSHFLIDSVAESDLFKGLSAVADIEILDAPKWAISILDKLRISNTRILSSNNRVELCESSNIILPHIPSYQRRGYIARQTLAKGFGESVNSFSTYVNQTSRRYCFLARLNDEQIRIVNQDCVIQWCQQIGIDIVYPSLLSVSQKRHTLSRYELIICDGGSSINNVLLFCKNLRACISIVPKSFIESPLHCLGGMQYLQCIQEKIRYYLPKQTCAHIKSGPVEAVHVDLSDIHQLLLQTIAEM